MSRRKMENVKYGISFIEIKTKALRNRIAMFRKAFF